MIAPSTPVFGNLSKGDITERVNQHYDYFRDTISWYGGSGLEESLERKHVPYQNLEHVNKVQGLGSKLWYESMTAQVIIGNVVNYIVGKGHEYRVSDREGASNSEDDLKRYRRHIDRFLDKQVWPVFQEDFYKRWYRSGDVLQHCEPEGKTLDVTWAEPHDLRTPENGDDAKYGIRYEKDRRKLPRVTRPEAYYFSNSQGKAAPIKAMNIHHCKRGVDINDPRGIPLLWNCYGECKEIDELQWALTQVMLAAAENSVVWEYPQGQQNSRKLDEVASAVEAHAKELAERGQTSDAGRHTIADGFTVQNYGAQIAAGEWINAIGAKERRIGVVANLPEFIMTGDADTGSRNSLFAAEGPMLRSVDREAEKGSKCEIKLLRKVVAAAENKWGDEKWMEDFEENVAITVKVPLPSTESEADRSKRLLAEVAAGLLDPQGFCEMVGRDYESVVAGIQEHNEKLRDNAMGAGPSAYDSDSLTTILGWASQIQTNGGDSLAFLKDFGIDVKEQKELLDANGFDTRQAA